MEIENILKKSWDSSTAYHGSRTRSSDNSITIQVYCWVLAIGYGRLSVHVLNSKS